MTTSLEPSWSDETVRELGRILHWRREQLLEAGYAADEAERLACEPEVDLHLAVELLHRGCPRDLALEILL